LLIVFEFLTGGGHVIHSPTEAQSRKAQPSC
jgi:hypothetical protein